MQRCPLWWCSEALILTLILTQSFSSTGFAQESSAVRVAIPADLVETGRRLDARRQALLKPLQRKIDVDYVGMPLQDVVQALGKRLGVPFWINQTEFDFRGIDVETGVTLRASGEGSGVLQQVLEPLELSYILRESVVEITSEQALAHETVTACYDLYPAVSAGKQMKEVKQETFMLGGRENWIEMGGTSSFSSIGSILVVSAPLPLQRKLERYVTSLNQRVSK